MVVMSKHALPRFRCWPLVLIAAPAAVAVWSGWVGLGALCGFGVIHPLPGIWDSLRLNTDITLPVGVESYGAYALYAWLASGASAKTRKFARRSALGALVLGCTGQVAYHLLAAAGDTTRAPAVVVVLVACLPVVTLSFAAALVHLMHADTVAAREAAREKAERDKAREAAAAARPPRKPAAASARTAAARKVARGGGPPVRPERSSQGGPDQRGTAPTDDLALEARALELLAGDLTMSGAELARKLGVTPGYGRKLRRRLTEQDRGRDEPSERSQDRSQDDAGDRAEDRP